ncbi:hypothetical protein AAGT95_03730 [Salinicola lusitanus]|uniref:Uncharacterized protein n=1 Tax=Salinicola lusitanus TaxID=1949085 RepID=A0ABZ3CVF7_9GAMM
MTGGWTDYLFSLGVLFTGAGMVLGAIVFSSRLQFHRWAVLLLWGIFFLFWSGWQAWSTYHAQPLSPSSVKEALGSNLCVAAAVRTRLDEFEQPMTRQELLDIEDDCECQAEQLAKSEADQAVLDKQRQAARQPEAEIGKK